MLRLIIKTNKNIKEKKQLTWPTRPNPQIMIWSRRSSVWKRGKPKRCQPL